MCVAALVFNMSTSWLDCVRLQHTFLDFEIQSYVCARILSCTTVQYALSGTVAYSVLRCMLSVSMRRTYSMKLKFLSPKFAC